MKLNIFEKKNSSKCYLFKHKTLYQTESIKALQEHGGQVGGSNVVGNGRERRGGRGDKNDVTFM